MTGAWSMGRNGELRGVDKGGSRLLVLGLFALLAAGCAKSNGRPWIHKIRIDGAKQVKAGDIRGKLAIQQASLIPFSSKHYLEHPYIIEVERERIETYYQARGYYSAKVIKAESIPYKTGKKPAVDILYTVEEGKPTRIRNVDVQGLEKLGEDADFVRRGIERQASLQPGKIFEHPNYVLAKEEALRYLLIRGYAFAKIDWDVDVNRDAGTADLRLVIDPGHKARIGRTVVDGAQTIKPEVIAKHAALNQGDEFRPALLETAQGKLYNLGIFNTVLVEPVQNPNDPQVADVRIMVSEGKMRELNLGVGFGIEPLRTEVHAEATFIKRSFFGGLRKLELGLRPGYAAVPAFWSSELQRHGPIIGMRADFTQPDLLGKSSELTVGIAYDLGLEYAYQYHGPALRIGIQKTFWRERIKLAASYNFQFLDFFETDAAILSDPGSAGTRYGYVDPYRLGYIQEQLVLDLRNRAIDASKGFFAGILAEQGGVYTGSAFNYQKLLPEMRGYVPLGRRVVVAARVQFGQIFVQGDLGSPITQRLYLGGPNSHRGFTYNRLSHQVCSAVVGEAPLPTKIDCLADPKGEGISDFRRLPIGGDQLLLMQLEMRVNLFKLAGQWFSMAGFVDAGDVAAPASDSQLRYLGAIDFRKLHVAVGGGLRYRTVVGAIRLDLGVRLNRLAPLDDTVENPDPGQRFAYHISIGEAF